MGEVIGVLSGHAGKHTLDDRHSHVGEFAKVPLAIDMSRHVLLLFDFESKSRPRSPWHCQRAPSHTHELSEYYPYLLLRYISTELGVAIDNFFLTIAANPGGRDGEASRYPMDERWIPECWRRIPTR